MQNVIKLKNVKSSLATPEDLITLDEIQSKYKFKYGTAYKYIVLEHRIPYFKLGRNIRVSEKDFKGLLQSCYKPIRG